LLTTVMARVRSVLTVTETIVAYGASLASGKSIDVRCGAVR